MFNGGPSRTALGAARHRALHQVLEGGRIFSDPLALRILGESEESIRSDPDANAAARRLRSFIALRSRFAEDALLAAVPSGVTQLVVLGAGLDTFAYRSALGDRLRVFEVDHPDTQAWKRARLLDAGIRVPSALTFVPVNFERETLADGLAAAGFDSAQPSFFSWLGVVPYLTRAAVFSTLGYIAALPAGAHAVFDYANPPAEMGSEQRARHEQLARRVTAAGERFESYFGTEELAAELGSLGFRGIEDLGAAQVAARYLPTVQPSAAGRGGRMVHAWTR
jgi:methyltransferase (TIGR00027 family)